MRSASRVSVYTLPAARSLGVAMLILTSLPRPATALPAGPAAALAMESRNAAPFAEPVRMSYRTSYRHGLRGGLRGGWSHRYGTMRHRPRVPRWLR